MTQFNFILNHKPSSCKKYVDEYILKANEFDTTLLKLSTMSLPSSFSLASKYNLNILDQDALGACVLNSFAGIINSYFQINTSRLYHYYICRVATNNLITDDSGLDLLESIPLLMSYGLVPEELCPYNIKNFSDTPPLVAFKNSIITNKFNIIPISQTILSIKKSLYDGFFVILGFYVYNSFLLKSTSLNGIIPMPNMSNETIQGGHCCHLIGWCNINNSPYFIMRNSWGKNWGNDGNINPDMTFINNGENGGFCYIPFEYIINPTLSFELCQISK